MHNTHITHVTISYSVFFVYGVSLLWVQTAYGTLFTIAVTMTSFKQVSRTELETPTLLNYRLITYKPSDLKYII